MPTYDYQCDACQHAFEEWQSFKDDALTKCPKCKKNKLRRLFGGGAAIIFKGSGFYETDYRRKDEEKKNGKPAESDKPAEAKTEAPKAEPAAASAASNGETGSKKESGKAKKAGK
jgi:putative FmdB family regulatory protein